MFRSEDHRAFAAASESGVAGAADQQRRRLGRASSAGCGRSSGEDIFSSWFGRLELDSVVDGCAYLTVPTRFLKSWIESHYADRVLASTAAEAADVERVAIGVRNRLAATPPAPSRRQAPRPAPPAPALARVPAASRRRLSASVPRTSAARSERSRRRAARSAPHLRQLHRRPLERACPRGSRPRRPCTRAARRSTTRSIFTRAWASARPTFCTPSAMRRARRAAA